MNRRNFFNQGSKIVIGATVLGGLKSTGAMAAEGDAAVVSTEISSNHGHALSLDVLGVIELLRRLQPENKTEVISIQGQSHPHNIEISFEQVLSVLLGEELIVTSTEDFGHAHDVKIVLELDG